MMRKCLDFVFKQKHYRDDKGQTLDRTRIQPKGAETFNTIRRKTAQICSQPPYFEAWPVDKMDDPQKAEGAKRVLESILNDPLKRYRPCKRRMVSGAMVASTWYMKAEWDYSCGPFGDIRFSSMKPMQVMPEPGWQDIHDPLCPRVWEVHDLCVRDIEGRKGWKNTAGLWPDNEGKYRSEQDYQRSVSDTSPDYQYEEDTVRVLFVWEKGDYTTEDRPTHRPLAPEDRYMACTTCGYRTMDHPQMPDGQFPVEGDPCPLCMESGKVNLMQRIDAERDNARYRKYPNGRLRIIAPYQHRKFYDGEWPEELRSYPFFQFRAYENPEEYHGLNDAALHWPQQVILNSLRRQGYEQMRTSKSLILVAGGPDGKGILDYRNRPFVLSDENGCVGYVQGPTVQGMVQHVQGQGLPSQWTNYYQAVLNSFTSTQGTNDLGLTPASSKDIAASTVQQLTEIGDIPVQDHIDVLNEEESIFLGVVLDMWVAHTDVARAVRYLGPEGKVIIEMLSGMDIPNVDVIVTAQPKMRSSNIDRFRVLQQWAQLPSPALRRIGARELNIPTSDVVQVEMELAAMPPTPPVTQGPSSPPSNGVAMAMNGAGGVP